MVSPSELAPQKPRSFDPPEEPAWHRMIAEAAYYLAERRGFAGQHSLDDWLAAEQQVRQKISRVSESEATMDDTSGPPQRPGAPGQSKPGHSKQSTPPSQEASRFEKFASTQAAGDGVQGDILKRAKTVDEKIGANMPDRK